MMLARSEKTTARVSLDVVLVLLNLIFDWLDLEDKENSQYTTRTLATKNSFLSGWHPIFAYYNVVFSFLL